MLKIDMVVITSISSHRGSSLRTGCYRNLRFILLLLASDEASKQDWEKMAVLPEPIKGEEECDIICCNEEGTEQKKKNKKK